MHSGRVRVERRPAAILAAGNPIGWWAKPCLIILLSALGMAEAQGQPVAEPQLYTEVFYYSGPLRIQAYLYRPPGNGPFPLVIYNHGSRENRERESRPFSYVGGILLQSGYAVLVPERRGYGRSDGLTFSEEMRQTLGRRGAAVESPQFVGRLQAEGDDVLSALEFIRTLPFVDQRRLGIMGWSFGGIVTMFAQNDRTTASITTLASALQAQNPATEVIIYPPFIPNRNPRNTAPGHLIFSEQGSAIWENDVRTFFSKHLGDGTSSGIR